MGKENPKAQEIPCPRTLSVPSLVSPPPPRTHPGEGLSSVDVVLSPRLPPPPPPSRRRALSPSGRSAGGHRRAEPGTRRAVRGSGVRGRAAPGRPPRRRDRRDRRCSTADSAQPPRLCLLRSADSVQPRGRRFSTADSVPGPRSALVSARALHPRAAPRPHPSSLLPARPRRQPPPPPGLAPRAKRAARGHRLGATSLRLPGPKTGDGQRRVRGGGSWGAQFSLFKWPGTRPGTKGAILAQWRPEEAWVQRGRGPWMMTRWLISPLSYALGLQGINQARGSRGRWDCHPTPSHPHCPILGGRASISQQMGLLLTGHHTEMHLPCFSSLFKSLLLFLIPGPGRSLAEVGESWV
jgi:hypothetical protein